LIERYQVLANIPPVLHADSVVFFGDIPPDLERSYEHFSQRYWEARALQDTLLQGRATPVESHLAWRIVAELWVVIVYYEAAHTHDCFNTRLSKALTTLWDCLDGYRRDPTPENNDRSINAQNDVRLITEGLDIYIPIGETYIYYLQTPHSSL
jgi:hypothetical protein